MLKTKTIKTDKATLLVMELPNGKYVRFHKGYIVQSCSTVLDLFNKCKRIDNGDTNGFIHIGNWQLLGRLPEITEEKSSKAVPTMPIQKGKTKRYITAKEALISLLQANEVYFENPVKLDSKPSFFINEKGEYEKSSFHDDLEIYYQDRNWEEAQSKVFDKERCYIFIKVD